MNIQLLKCFFMWNTIINFALFLMAFLIYRIASKLIYDIFNSWYGITREKFKNAYFNSMMIMKIIILVFNLAPFLALTIIY